MLVGVEVWGKQQSFRSFLIPAAQWVSYTGTCFKNSIFEEHFWWGKRSCAAPSRHEQCFYHEIRFQYLYQGSSAQNSQIYHKKKRAESEHRGFVSRCARSFKWWLCWLFISLAVMLQNQCLHCPLTQPCSLCCSKPLLRYLHTGLNTEAE